MELKGSNPKRNQRWLNPKKKPGMVISKKEVFKELMDLLKLLMRKQLYLTIGLVEVSILKFMWIYSNLFQICWLFTCDLISVGVHKEVLGVL